MLKLPVLISIIYGLQLTIYQHSQSLMAYHHEYIEVNGYAKILSGNQMPMNKDSILGAIPLEGVKIIAVSGSVKTIEGKPNIPLKKISSPLIETTTNKDGGFKFLLAPGQYTFFLVDGDKAYLNSFNGYGFFMETNLTSPMNELLILDDRNTTY